jgi:hypothetical protein
VTSVTRLLDFSFALWSSAVCFSWSHIMHLPWIHSSFWWGVHLGWPGSIVYQTAFLTVLQAVTLLVGLGMYRCLARRFHRFLRGLVALLVLAGFNLGGMCFDVLQPSLALKYAFFGASLFVSTLICLEIMRPAKQHLLDVPD